MLSHMLSHPGEVVKPDQFGRYIKGVANNLPDLFAKTNAVRRVPGGGLIEIPFEHRPVIDIVLSKWAKAFYYMETGQIVPCAASIITHIYTNIDADKIPYAVFTAKQHSLRAGKKSLEAQMQLHSVSDPTTGHALFGVAFRRSFFAVMVVDVHGTLGQSVSDIPDAPSGA